MAISAFPIRGSISGGTHPGGLNTQIQFNANNVFSGTSEFIWDNTKKALTVGIRSGTTTGNFSFVGGCCNAAIGNSSFATGCLTIAYGKSSFTSGRNTRAYGRYSHTEGRSTISFGLYSHTEGLATIACCDSSHAEGLLTCAIGKNSHAEGCNTCAIGFNSHAEGLSTKACTDSSHSQNSATITIGNSSHAGGKGLTTGNKYIYACGQSSFNHSENNSSQTAGFGANANNSAILGGLNHNINSAAVRSAIIGGCGICLNSISYCDTVAVPNLAIWNIPTTSVLGCALIWDSNDKKIKVNNTLSGQTNAGTNIGSGIGIYTGKTGVNLRFKSIKAGTNVTLDDSNPNQITINSSAGAGIPAGANKEIQINDSGAFGACNRFRYDKTLTAFESGIRSGSTGCFSIAFGCFALASNSGATSMGICNAACGIGSAAIGFGNKAICDYSFAEGNGNIANGIASHVEGCSTTTTAVNSHAEGRCTCAAGSYSHIGGLGVGSGKQVFASGIVAFNHSENDSSQTAGYGANANNSAILGGVDHNINSAAVRAAIIGGCGINLNGIAYCDIVAVPNFAIWCTPTTSTCINALVWDNTDKIVKLNSLLAGETNAGANVGGGLGIYTGKSGLNLQFRSLCAGTGIIFNNDTTSITICSTAGGGPGGSNTNVQINDGGIFYGNSNFTYNKSKFSLTLGTRAVGGIGNNSFTQGCCNIAYDDNSHAEGFCAQAIGTNSHTEGYINIAKGNTSHAEGFCTLSCGLISHAEGWCTCSCGVASHTEGFGTIACDPNAHAEGCITKACRNAHAEGYNTQALGCNSHTEGFTTMAQGYNSHAEGGNTCASQITSHAEGCSTKSLNTAAHAEGISTCASGIASHAEGNFTKSIGNNSHAEGTCTFACGCRSHSEGYCTFACECSSHAEGYCTFAYGRYSHTQGSRTVANCFATHAGGIGLQDKEIRTTARAAFIHSENNASQSVGFGANADNSAILGGVNHNISNVAIRSAIIGGCSISLTSSDYCDTLAVSCFAIWCLPSVSSVGDKVLLYNPTTKKVTQNTCASISDARLKTNLCAISSCALCITQLNGYEFSFDTTKVNDFTRHYGLIAQDVEKYFPHVVRNNYKLDKSKGDDTLYKTIEYRELVPILVEAIKQQEIKIDNLEKRIFKLEKK